MLEELSGFEGAFGKEKILEVLEQEQWDVERTFGALVTLLEQNTNQAEKAREVERAAQQKQNGSSFLKLLLRSAQETFVKMTAVFREVPEAEVQRIIDENDGDIEQVVNKLIEANEKLVEVGRQAQVDNFVRRFGCSPDRTRQILEQNKWNDRLATQILVPETTERRSRECQAQFPKLTLDEIQHALVIKDYNQAQWIAELNLLTQQKEEQARRVAEEEARVKAEAERQEREKERLAAEERARIADAEARRLEEEKARALALQEKERQLMEKLEEAKRKEIEKKEQDALKLQKAFAASVLAAADQMERSGARRKQVLQNHLEDLVINVHAAHQEPAPVVAAPVGPSPVAEPKPNPNQGMIDTTPPQPDAVVVLSASPERSNAGSSSFEVKWKHSAEPTSKDWIGMYRPGAPNNSYITYQTVSASGRREGTLSFPPTWVLGDFEFRYMSNNYQLFGTTGLVRVGPTFQLTPVVKQERTVEIQIKKTAGDSAPNAWIGLYHGNVSSYLHYEWVPKDEMSITFQLPPKKTGLWRFKLFGAKTEDTQIAECTYKIEGDDTLSLRFTDNATVISYNLNTVDHSSDRVWVGLYQKDAENRKWKFTQWIYSSEGSCTINKRPPAGVYQARLFARGTLDVLAQSPVVELD